MITIRRLRIGESALFKQIRLAALHESPSAFLSTYESALQRSDESWRMQADSTAQGPDRATFIALSADAPIGITAIYRDQQRTEVGELLQVWIAPEHRGTTVARDLLNVVIQWAKGNGFHEIVATIAKENLRAQRFYEKSGFTLGLDDTFALCGLSTQGYQALPNPMGSTSPRRAGFLTRQNFGG